MRSVVNISLPKVLTEVVEETVASGRYSSKSEFFRTLLRMWMEGRLLKDIRESEKEFASGGGKKLRSLKDLW